MTMLVRHCENRASDSWQSITKNYKKALFGNFLLWIATHCVAMLAMTEATPSHCGVATFPPPLRRGLGGG
ncbi:hypothetical protein [Helicobacter sp. T3_23-1056]